MIQVGNLKEVLSNLRVVYPSKHQFLGDLFEQLLNRGFKQNEGQIFTPTPITRFIWDSLPLQSYINRHDLPRVIDYACGAGHFLTEAVEAINAARPDSDNSWVETHIYGIEKDYRGPRLPSFRGRYATSRHSPLPLQIKRNSTAES